jgi:hypothetical protein
MFHSKNPIMHMVYKSNITWNYGVVLWIYEEAC